MLIALCIITFFILIALAVKWENNKHSSIPSDIANNRLTDSEILELYKKSGAFVTTKVVVVGHNLNISQAKKYIDRIIEQDQYKDDIKVPVKELGKYIGSGCIDDVTFDRLNRATLNGKSYVYIDKDAYELMKEKYKAFIKRRSANDISFDRANNSKP